MKFLPAIKGQLWKTNSISMRPPMVGAEGGIFWFWDHTLCRRALSETIFSTNRAQKLLVNIAEMSTLSANILSDGWGKIVKMIALPITLLSSPASHSQTLLAVQLPWHLPPQFYIRCKLKIICLFRIMLILFHGHEYRVGIQSHENSNNWFHGDFKWLLLKLMTP